MFITVCVKWIQSHRMHCCTLEHKGMLNSHWVNSSQVVLKRQQHLARMQTLLCTHIAAGSTEVNVWDCHFPPYLAVWNFIWIVMKRDQYQRCAYSHSLTLMSLPQSLSFEACQVTWHAILDFRLPFGNQPAPGWNRKNEKRRKFPQGYAGNWVRNIKRATLIVYILGFCRSGRNSSKWFSWFWWVLQYTAQLSLSLILSLSLCPFIDCLFFVL